MARFEELEEWKKSARLSADLYKAMASNKDFGFRDQITRADLSIPSNIAEGYERGSNKEITNFLNYAKGSAGELRTQIYIGMDIGYIDKETGKHWIAEAESISRMLHALIRQSAPVSLLPETCNLKPATALHMKPATCNLQPKIYVAGHRGMVGSAIIRVLNSQGQSNLVTRTHAERDELVKKYGYKAIDGHE